MTDTVADLAVAVRTLLAGGFILESVSREPGYAAILCSRADRFGLAAPYCVLVMDGDSASAAQTEAGQILASRYGARLVIVAMSGDGADLTWDQFVNRLGGPVFNTRPLELGFDEDLVTLGHNLLPEHLEGTPSDLFEDYARDALEFIFGARVIKYGQDRRFEVVPDGIVLPHADFYALYDAKAYNDGYPVSEGSIRQFQSYVVDFQTRYGGGCPDFRGKKVTVIRPR